MAGARAPLARCARACCVSRGAAVQERRGVCVRAASWVGLSAFLGSVAVPLPPAHPTRAALRKRACAGTLCDVSSVCGTIVLYWVPFGPIVPKRISVRVCSKESDWWSAFSARRPLGANTLPLHAAIPRAATLTRNRSAGWSAFIVALSRRPLGRTRSSAYCEPRRLRVEVTLRQGAQPLGPYRDVHVFGV